MNMMHIPSVDTDEGIDRRIVKQEYRNYDLVARFWEISYLGKIWKNRKAVEEVEPEGDEGIDELVEKMKARVDEIIGKKLRARDNQPPSAAELAAALHQVAPKFNQVEIQLLKAHSACSNGLASMDILQKVTGYHSTAAVLMTYSNIAQRLCDEIPCQLKVTPGGYPAVNLLLRQVPKDHRSLTLKKDAVRAIAEMQW